ncbi:hypothetical protein [Amycolatopsis sp. La24]|nr:hypothetical protein [Amycolatopsis sp. La24]
MDAPDRTKLAELFHAQHDILSGYRAEDEPVEVLNLRQAATAD